MKINTINSYYIPNKSKLSFKNNAPTDVVIAAPKQDVTQFKNNMKQETSFFKSARNAIKNFIQPNLDGGMLSNQDLAELILMHANVL